MTSILASGTAGGIIGIILYIVIFGAAIYFLMVKPQKKEQQKMAALQNSVEVGDSILTTSGFYGVVIGVEEDDVIVEFGNNKNCRIPMKKAAIQEKVANLREAVKNYKRDLQEKKLRESSFEDLLKPVSQARQELAKAVADAIIKILVNQDN